MRRLIPVLGILLVSTSANAQDPVKVDPAHHKVEIDNERVRVLRGTLGPHEKTPAHDHPAGVAVFLSNNTVRVSPRGGAPREETHKRGDVLLTPAGNHMFENLSATPAEIVMIELKTPAIRPWQGVELDGVKVDPNNFKAIAENDQVRVLHATAKAPAIEHEHPAYVYVLMSGGSGTPGAVRSRAPVKHAPVNDGVTIMVELKTQVGTARK